MSTWFTAPEIQQHVSPEEVIALAIREHNPVRIFACFSSGNDSLISTHIAMKNGANEVFNVNTTIGLPEARQHFYAMCEKFRWNHRVKFPPDRDYETMVMEDGFPGPGAHIYPYSWLKERAIRELVAESKVAVHDRVMLITGVRSRESTKRMGYVEPCVRKDCTVWVAPIFDFTDADKEAYMEKHGLPHSPVTEALGISGECLCGAFARAGERRRIANFNPTFDANITALELKAKSAKQPYCEWGNGRRVDPNQEEIFMAMCADCH